MLSAFHCKHHMYSFLPISDNNPETTGITICILHHITIKTILGLGQEKLYSIFASVVILHIKAAILKFPGSKPSWIKCRFTFTYTCDCFSSVAQMLYRHKTISNSIFPLCYRYLKLNFLRPRNMNGGTACIIIIENKKLYGKQMQIVYANTKLKVVFHILMTKAKKSNTRFPFKQESRDIFRLQGWC